MPHPDLCPEFLSGCIGGQGQQRLKTWFLENWITGSVLYFTIPALSLLISVKVWGGISWSICPKVLRMHIPRSGKDFAGGPLNVLFLLTVTKTLRTAHLTCLPWSKEWFPLAAFPHSYNYWSITHYHNHWSYRIEYLVNISHHLIIILYIRGSVPNLVMQETIVL